MPDAVRTELEESATNPKKVESDGVKVEKHPLKDVIDADRYLDGDTGVAQPTRGLRFSKLVMPATGS